MNAIYDAFRTSVLTGFGFIHQEAADVYLFLAGLAFLAILLGFLISPKDINVSSPMAWGLMAIALGIFIDWFPALSQGWGEAMWEVGSSAVSGASVNDFADFDGLLESGYGMASPIISSLHGWSLWELASRFEDWIFGWMAVGVLILTNAYLAFRLFILMLSYLVMSLVAMVALPMMLWQQTSFLGEGALRFVAGTGISILGFGAVLSTVWGVADASQFTADMTKLEIIGQVATVIVGFLLALNTQSLIQGYFAGVPNMGSGIGKTTRSALFAAHHAGALLKGIGAVRNAAGGGGTGPQTHNSAPTNPSINFGGGNSGVGGNWRQPGGIRPNARP